MKEIGDFMEKFSVISNILPYDGEVFLSRAKVSDRLSLESLDFLANHIDWKKDVIKLFGKTIQTDREYSFLGQERFKYKYSKIVRMAEIWKQRFLLELKKEIEEITGGDFNAVLMSRRGLEMAPDGFNATLNTITASAGLIRGGVLY